MTRNEVRQMHKNTALNKIVKIVKKGIDFDRWDSRSVSQQEMEEIRWVVEQLERDLKET